MLILTLAVLETLVLAPRQELASGRVWLLIGGAGLLFVALATLLVLALSALLRALGARQLSAADIGFVLVGGIAAGVVLRPLAESLVGAPLLALSLDARLLAIGAGSAAGLALVLAALRRRQGLDARSLALPLGVLLALPTALSFGLQGNGIATVAHLRPVLAGGVLLVIGAVLAVTLFGGRWRAVLVAVIALLGCAALTSGIPNQNAPAQVSPPDVSRAKGPPIVLIVLDTMRADAIDRRDPATSATPVLAELAAHADVYTQAIANASWTLPGHASLFTGLSVARHRTDLTAEPGFSPVLSAEIPTGAELLGAAGYRTRCIVANGIVSFSSGLARGCQQYFNPARLWLLNVFPLRLWKRVAGDASPVSQLVLELTGLNLNPTAREIVDASLDGLAQDGSGEYVFLNFLDVHGPLTAPRGDTRVPPERRAAYRWDLARWVLRRIDAETLSRRYADVQRADYAAQASVLDRELGRLFQRLRDAGWWNDALVIVTADHGEAFHDNPTLRGYFGHHSAWEPAVRIPLIVKRPGQGNGSVFAGAVQQTAVLPTLLAGAGVPPPAGLDDHALDGMPRERVITEWYARLDPGDFPFVPVNRFALYRDGLKYVREADGREFLFDLTASPWEEVDVAAREPERLAALRQELDSVENEARREPGAAPSPELLEKLRNLGYVH